MNVSTLWQTMLHETLVNGHLVTPRGAVTKEVLHRTITVDMRHPVLRVPERKLNYRFMAAEAFWILSGDDKVATISPYNPNISQYSDDGETFFGAYGPRIAAQLPYVVDTLLADYDTRRAGLTIWRESPPSTKDVPCTISIFFSLRQRHVHAHVFMRSSDIWLGVPYDIFNVSMLTHLVCGKLYQRGLYDTAPGTLYLTAASSHLYETNWDQASTCIAASALPQAPVPSRLAQDPQLLLETLALLRSAERGDPRRWWEAV